MKKFCLSLLCLALLSLATAPAWAIPAIDAAFKKAYVEGNTNAKFVEAAGAAKCNVCHVGKDKKMKNEYGTTVAKFLKKADIGPGKTVDPTTDEGKKTLAEGLEKAAAEKNASGKTFGELLKAGELPGGAS
jgi:hypothetical protein